MQKEYLSKVKHIYRVYSSSRHEIHLEKLAVVYINKSYIYFIKNHSEELGKISMSLVRDLFKDCNDLKSIPYGHTETYFFKINDIQNFNGQEIAKAYFTMQEENKLKREENRVNELKMKYEQELANLEVLRKLKENLE